MIKKTLFLLGIATFGGGGTIATSKILRESNDHERNLLLNDGELVLDGLNYQDFDDDFDELENKRDEERKLKEMTLPRDKFCKLKSVGKGKCLFEYHSGWPYHEYFTFDGIKKQKACEQLCYMFRDGKCKGYEYDKNSHECIIFTDHPVLSANFDRNKKCYLMECQNENWKKYFKDANLDFNDDTHHNPVQGDITTSHYDGECFQELVDKNGDGGRCMVGKSKGNYVRLKGVESQAACHYLCINSQYPTPYKHQRCYAFEHWIKNEVCHLHFEMPDNIKPDGDSSCYTNFECDFDYNNDLPRTGFNDGFAPYWRWNHPEGGTAYPNDYECCFP